jgi:hypothetical protein
MERNYLISFINECLENAKRCNQPQVFFNQAFGAVGLYNSIAYAKGDLEEEKAVANLWNDDYRHRFEELIYGRLGE